MGRWGLMWDLEVEAVVDATPEQVWRVLSDVPRVGEWSHECHSASWVEGHGTAVVGAQFFGSNRAGRMRWGRRCTITEAMPRQTLVYRTSGGIPPDSTEWRFEIEALPSGGTRIRQSFRILRMSRAMEAAIYLLVPRHRDRSEALRADLVRLGEVAAGVLPSSHR